MVLTVPYIVVLNGVGFTQDSVFAQMNALSIIVLSTLRIGS